MGWTDLSNGDKSPQDVSIHNEFTAALAERAEALGDSSPTDVVAGDVSQAASLPGSKYSLIEMVDWIDSECDRFVQCAETTTGTPITGFDGETYIPMWSSANLWRTVNGNASHSGGPPCYTVGTGGTPAYRTPQVGDVLRAETFIAVQDAFNLMVWTKPATNDEPIGEYPDANYRYAYGTDASSPSAAIANAQSDWISDPDDSRQSNPTDDAIAGYEVDYFDDESRCRIHCAELVLSVFTGSNVNYEGQVDFYVIPRLMTPTYNAVFDTQGVEGLHTVNVLNLYTSQAVPANHGGASGFQLSQHLCDDYTVMPPNAPDVSGWTPDDSVKFGFTLSQNAFERYRAVMRWDVAGGFEYVS